MATVLLVVHLLIALGLVGVILIQRSEGGGLGVGGSGSGFMTTRGTANLLTRATAILAGLFFISSLSLALLARYDRPAAPVSIIDEPVKQPTPPTPAAPAPPLSR